MQFVRLTVRSRRALLCAVLLAVGLTQTLGLLHRVVHGAHASQPRIAAIAAHVAGAAVAVDAVAADPAAASGASWLKALFAGHDSTERCMLYEQSSHADMTVGEVAGQCPATGDALVAEVHPAWHLAAQAAGFLARGPPRRS